METRLPISEYRGVWLFAIFDLPVVTQEEKRRYVQFRKALLKDGFDMMQYSVYARYCPNEESCNTHRKRVRKALPPEGHVRLLMVTDKQYGKMEVYFGKKKKPAEDPPDQLTLL